MAMPFGDSRLDNIFVTHWKNAVAATGFELRRLDEGSQAGLIDNRLRVEIRRSRFLVAELSEQNPNVYWQAGFAEGLERPVIYTCEKSQFDKRGFDAEHSQTVQWEKSQLSAAAADLTATIRNTLPDEAKMTDD
jgi:hypothetical protein